MRSIFWINLWLTLASGALAGQTDSLRRVIATTRVDTTRINGLQALAKRVAADDPDSALVIGHRALALAARIDWAPGLAESHYQVARLLSLANQLDSAIYHHEQSLHHCREAGKEHLLADNYYHRATNFSNQDKYEQSLASYEQALAIYHRLEDEATIMRCNINCAWVLSELGRFPEAAELLYESIRLAEKLDAPRSIFNARHELGYLHLQMDRMEDAKTIFLENEALALELDDLYKQSVAYGDLGLYFYEVADYERALSYDLKDLAIQRELGNDKDLSLIYNNISANYLALERYELAIQYLEQSLATGGEHRATYNHILSVLQMGLAQRGLKRYSTARNYLESALEQALAINNHELVQDARESLVKVYSELGNYERALALNQDYHALRDSLASLENKRQVAELEAQYQAEKRAREILLLEKNATISQARQTQLGIALLAVVLLGVLLVFTLWQRRKKDRRIFEQQRAIERERRRNAELENEQLNRELDFKKQELAAKVLQLCKKNEFLQSLEKRVAELSHNGDADVQRSSAQLSHLIHRDAAAEEDWDAFIQTFTEVHPSFFRDLTERHAGLSKSELRLASLLRMNLSSKDISSLLNISAEGVKKARYRLRKKLDLTSDQELEGYLIAL